MQDAENSQPTIESDYGGTRFGNDCDQASKTFVLINCIDNDTDGVVDRIKRIDSAVQIQKTDGSYDIVVTLEADTSDKIRKALHEIRANNAVSHSVILRPSPDTGDLG